MSEYNHARGNVVKMFQALSHTGGAVAITWVRELYYAYKSLVGAT